MPAFQDLTGQRFGRLTVVSRAENVKNGKVRWHCFCDCGNKSIAITTYLRNGHTKSCGCLLSEILKSRNTTHGMARTRTYEVWRSMKDRCLVPSSTSYPRYGGRGITVCDRWLKFENFLEDMGKCPLGLTLDRIDNDLGYSPENCRWATTEEQANNKRTNRLIEFEGRTQTLAQWAKEKGIAFKTLYSRLFRGQSIENALNLPVKQAKVSSPKKDPTQL